MIKAVRGTRDLLPPETALWNFVEEKVREVFRAYNFQEIRTPIFESTELFARGVGEETDIVSKEMYSWHDGESIVAGLIKGWLQANPTATAYRQSTGLMIMRYEPDFVAQLNDGLVVLDVKSRPSKAAVDSLHEYTQFLREHTTDRNAGPIRSILVFPSRANVPSSVQEESERLGVKLEPVEYEPSQSLTLRPENTAGTVRAYIEHKLWDRGLNKLYYIGPQFRRERPQKGRYRQFYQIGAEVIGPASAGSESPARDAEVLEMLATLLDRLGIANWTLELNSVGCPNDRAAFNEALRKALEPVVGKMCVDCQRRAVTNPLRVLDCKVPEDQPIIETLPRISQFLDEGCRKHFDAVQEILKVVGVPFVLNDRLVRGLDYYTRTAFEFTHGALGAQNAILGGGRYDGLSEALGGPPAPGIGFAIGEDRLVMSLAESADSVLRNPDAYIAPLGVGMNREAARLARELRRNDVVVELGDESFRLKKSFEAAAKLAARNVIILGENEVNSGMIAVKNQQTGEQIAVPRAELPAKL